MNASAIPRAKPRTTSSLTEASPYKSSTLKKCFFIVCTLYLGVELTNQGGVDEEEHDEGDDADDSKEYHQALDDEVGGEEPRLLLLGSEEEAQAIQYMQKEILMKLEKNCSV